MELIFIRHGQGEHTINSPESLKISNPSLTSKGVKQAQKLRSEISLTTEDMLVVSPTLRTLQTASIWSEGVKCRKFVHPLAGPRIFPARIEAVTLPCDELLSLEKVEEEFSDFIPASNLTLSLWSSGINVRTEDEFNVLAKEFIRFCRSLQREKVYIVTHDGTITSYRKEVSGQLLTRKDFLKETEWFRLLIDQ